MIVHRPGISSSAEPPPGACGRCSRPAGAAASASRRRCRSCSPRMRPRRYDPTSSFATLSLYDREPARGAALGQVPPAPSRGLKPQPRYRLPVARAAT